MAAKELVVEVKNPNGSADEGLVLMQPSAIEYLHPVMDLQTAKARLLEFQQFVKFYLKDGEDFGIIPGTPKPTLLKPGADKLCELYGLADTYPDSRIHRVEDWSKDPPLFDYEVTCVLVHKSAGIVVGEGMGSCNSYEGKYRWRESSRKCTACGKENIIKGKQEYGGGWLCFAKKGGCGAKFADNAPEIVNQGVGRIPNPDIADIKNTILKMAKKRSKIDATIAATRSSGIFTQDLEDIQQPQVAHIQSVGLENLPEHLEWIANCATMDELKQMYMAAIKAAQSVNDAAAMRAIIDAKESRKKELQ